MLVPANVSYGTRIAQSSSQEVTGPCHEVHMDTHVWS